MHKHDIPFAATIFDVLTSKGLSLSLNCCEGFTDEDSATIYVLLCKRETELGHLLKYKIFIASDYLFAKLNCSCFSVCKKGVEGSSTGGYGTIRFGKKGINQIHPLK